MERNFESRNRLVFFEKTNGKIRPNYVGRSGVEDIFNSESMAVISKEDYGNWGIVVYDGEEVEFIHLYDNLRTIKNGLNLTGAIYRGDTMICDETIKLKCEKNIPDSLIDEIKKYGFNEKY